MDRSAIVIRDIPYGDDLTVPEAIARLCSGGPVTVTVTGPAPPGGDPRGNPRHGSGITVYPADGTRRPKRPAKIAWAGTSCRIPAEAAMLADALNLAAHLVTWINIGGGQAIPALAAAIGDSCGRDTARRTLAAVAPAAGGGIAARLDDASDLVARMLAERDFGYDPDSLAASLGVDPASLVFGEAEDAYVASADEAFWAEAGRIARERAVQDPEASPRRGGA